MNPFRAPVSLLVAIFRLLRRAAGLPLAIRQRFVAHPRRAFATTATFVVAELFLYLGLLIPAAAALLAAVSELLIWILLGPQPARQRLRRPRPRTAGGTGETT